ncbi:hypothetical protein DFJ74DRAFT_657383 [Hyaloraphidium curvatum]|nr:hypothetical protein DFJ74DRAFT_657383 [Hyaloraphidium curvatum]
MKSRGDYELGEENWERQFDTKRTFGEKAADAVARRGGSWTFVLSLLGFLVVWCLLNSVVLPEQYRWDPFPFILLNLFLSMLAAFQAPVIMMSQNRQAARDRVESLFVATHTLRAEHTSRHINAKLDHLVHGGWRRMMEVMELQLWLADPEHASRGDKKAKGAKAAAGKRVRFSVPGTKSADPHLLYLLRCSSGSPSPLLFQRWHRLGDNYSCLPTNVAFHLSSSGTLKHASYDLVPSDPGAALDDMFHGEARVTLRNDLGLPEQLPRGRILRIRAEYADGTTGAWDNGALPERYAPSFGTRREEAVAREWRAAVVRVGMDYAPPAQGAAVGFVRVPAGCAGEGKVRVGVGEGRAWVRRLEEGEGVKEVLATCAEFAAAGDGFFPSGAWIQVGGDGRVELDEGMWAVWAQGGGRADVDVRVAPADGEEAERGQATDAEREERGEATDAEREERLDGETSAS